MTAAIIIVVVVYLAFHTGHAYANYRHGLANGHRGVSLFWSSARGPYITIPGQYGTQIEHRLLSTSGKPETPRQA